MNSTYLVLLLLFFIGFSSQVQAEPNDQMTRIQGVLQTLLGKKPHGSNRIKKFADEYPRFLRYNDGLTQLGLIEI
uniref:Secreted protein n=1 Tax=Panagrellus redivivus TaxID=6233 RepID=A0A7E4UZH4_PANRE